MADQQDERRRQVAVWFKIPTGIYTSEFAASDLARELRAHARQFDGSFDGSKAADDDKRRHEKDAASSN